jgi:DNA-binding CsgD family transcriptional regulator
LIDEMLVPVRVGVRHLPPVITDGVYGWLRRDRRTAPVSSGCAADVIVLDPHRDGTDRLSGLIALTTSGNRVVAFSPARSPDAIAAVMAAGVHAFVSQSRHRRYLIDAIVTVAAGRPFEPDPAVLAPPGLRRPVPRLSEREHIALVWWMQSMTKASVARRMGVSPHTVDMYVKRIRAKYAEVGCPVPTKADLLARAVEDGLVGPEDLLDDRIPRPRTATGPTA